jgi:hypothetical protein
MGAGPLVVTYSLTGRSRAIVEEELGGTAEAIYLVDLAPAARAHALGRAGVVLSHDTSKELRPDEIPLIRNARLLQFTAAGVDWVPTRDLPWELPVAANKGGGVEPMSEHIVALALAAAKRLFIEHANLKSGEFNQRSTNQMLRAQGTRRRLYELRPDPGGAASQIAERSGGRTAEVAGMKGHPPRPPSPGKRPSAARVRPTRRWSKGASNTWSHPGFCGLGRPIGPTRPASSAAGPCLRRRFLRS